MKIEFKGLRMWIEVVKILEVDLIMVRLLVKNQIISYLVSRTRSSAIWFLFWYNDINLSGYSYYSQIEDKATKVNNVHSGIDLCTGK